MTLSFWADGIENPANVERLADAADLLGGTVLSSPEGRLIAVENVPHAASIYGRSPLRMAATLLLGNERRGISRSWLARADETIAIPVTSRTVRTLNVAAAAAVAGWYVRHGSSAQRRTTRPEHRRPALLLAGEDHVEVGSTLRSAAAFGFRDVMLLRPGAGWFDGSSSARREARAAARRFKNPIRVHPVELDVVARYEEIVLVTERGGRDLASVGLARGQRQLIVVGVDATRLEEVAPGRVSFASIGAMSAGSTHLRLLGSIVLAEVARQVGRRVAPVVTPTQRAPRFDLAARLMPAEDVLVVDPERLLSY